MSTTQPNSGNYQYFNGVPYYQQQPAIALPNILPGQPLRPGLQPLDTFLIQPFPLAPGGRLTPGQLAQLLSEHTFIAMGSSDYCLFCYALDHYRSSAEHIFVIHEE